MESTPFEIVLVSSGHTALDQRVFAKQAVSLARAFPAVRVVAPHDGDGECNGVRISALKPYSNRLQRFLLRPLQAFWRARGAGRRLLILHDAELLWWVPLVRAFTKWRIIYDVHENFPELLLSRTWIPAALRPHISHAVDVVEKSFSQSCDGVTGATEVLVSYFTHPRRTALYNLPDADFVAVCAARQRPPAQRTYDVLHLGTLAEEGRLPFLHAVLEGLFAARPAERALVIGVRPDQEATLRAAFPPERLTVRGKVPYDEVPALLGDCRVGLNVQPTLLPHLRCAVPVKVFEYMAGGCNVVTHYMPELHRILGKGGAARVRTVYSPATSAYLETLLALLDDPEAQARNRTALLALVESRFTWAHEAEKLVRLVREIMGFHDVPVEAPQV
jgi:glycosyltransferase involved in cell wall biosynthesis